MKRRERAVDDCAEDAAFSPSRADAAGIAFKDAEERLGEMAKLAGFDFYLLSSFPRGDRTAFVENRLLSNWPQSLVGFYEAGPLVGIENFPQVTRALEAFMARPAVARGIHIPARG